MGGLWAKLGALWRARRQRRAGDALACVKARHHVFRILLADNERALEALADIDRLSAENEPARLEGRVAELCDIALELADGLNRLTANAYAGLYVRLDALSDELARALRRRRAASGEVWLPLAEVTADHREQAGGKAQPLGELVRAGVPVPDAVVVTRGACRDYLRQARLDDRLKALARAAREPGADLESLAASAQAMIAASEPSVPLAAQLANAWRLLARDGAAGVSVRSSASGEDGAERSFAGQYVSVLNVRSADSFVRAFKTVLAGAFSARALAYREQAGLENQTMDMAVLCQRMVDARVSGVLFTVDPMTPDSGRMLLTAVYGLGTQAVSGGSPADIYRPGRDLVPVTAQNTPVEPANKPVREVPDRRGGLRLENVPLDLRGVRALDFGQVARLRDLGLRIEALAGGPQDIEWAMDQHGEIWILQARPARLDKAAHGASIATGACGARLLGDGHGASPGKAAGRVRVARSREELAALAGRNQEEGPVIVALHQSLVDAARLVPGVAGLLVDLGNPLDHLACVCREAGVPMITGLGRATTALADGRWVLMDAGRGEVCATDPALWRDAPHRPARRVGPAAGPASAVRALVLPLNLTDAYGPTFSVLECRTLHDLVRFIHEKAVLALFETGDAVVEEAFSLVRRIKNLPGLDFMILDMGGGLAPGERRAIALEDVLCEPLLALCRGMAAPGLRWKTPPPGASIGGLMTRALLDAGGERPVGNPNYALVTRDYLNMNARVDYHFAMVDAVCGANPRENSIRFRFKGGATTRVQRERRARFVETVLRESEFYAVRQGDMVTAVLMDAPRQVVAAGLEMLGRLLGFSRLLDAAMLDDETPARVARAFLAGDYALKGFDPAR